MLAVLARWSMAGGAIRALEPRPCVFRPRIAPKGMATSADSPEGASRRQVRWRCVSGCLRRADGNRLDAGRGPKALVERSDRPAIAIGLADGDGPVDHTRVVAAGDDVRVRRTACLCRTGVACVAGFSKGEHWSDYDVEIARGKRTCEAARTAGTGVAPERGNHAGFDLARAATEKHSAALAITIAADGRFTTAPLTPSCGAIHRRA